MTKLHSQANAIRNIKFSKDREQDFEIKKEMIDVLKEKTNYKKDEEASKEKRDRWSKIRDLAWDDLEKIKNMKDILYKKEEKQENTKQKEEIEWLPKLAEHNFRVEDTSNWNEITDPNGEKVLENPKWDVWEYLEWKKKWEQLFTKASAIRETKAAEKKLPASYKVFKDIIEQKYEWDYQAFLLWEGYKNKNWDKTGKFCGWRNPNNKKFYNIDKVFDIWCEDGSNFNGNNNKWNHNDNNDNYGFSVRCTQDWNRLIHLFGSVFIIYNSTHAR